MQEESITGATFGPSLSARAMRALNSTQGWARFAGVAMLVAALLKLVQTGLFLSHFHGNPQIRQLNPAAQNGAFGVAIVVALIVAAIYVVIGWLALRYAERLNHVKPPRRPEPGDIAGALGAQHSYWRFQGVLMIVAIALIVLAFVGAIVIGVIVSAAHH